MCRAFTPKTPKGAYADGQGLRQPARSGAPGSRPRHPRLLGYPLVVFLGLGLAWPALSVGAAPEPQKGPELQKVRVALTNREVVDNLPYLVGIRLGFFKEVGIDLQPAFFRGDDEVVKAITQRATDLAGSAAPSAIFIAVSKGEPIKILSGNVAPMVGVVWIVRTNSSIRSVKDLRGKKIGFNSPGSVIHTTLQTILKAEELEGQANLVQVGTAGDNWIAVRNGIIDAGWHTAPAVNALLTTREARIVISGSDYIKNYMQSSVAAMRDVIEKDPEMIRNFLRARARAVKFIWESPPRTIALWADELRLPVDAVRLAYRQLPKTVFEVSLPKIEDLQGTMQEVIQSGALKEPFDIIQVLDLRFLP